MSEFYPILTDPVKGAAAFSRINEDTSPPQAAALLMMGRQLAPQKPSAKISKAALEAEYLAAAGLADDSDFPTPRLRGGRSGAGVRDVSARLKKTYNFVRPKAGDWQALEKPYQDCAERCFKRARFDDAIDLIQMCLDHPKTLVRVAAAAAYWPVISGRKRCAQLLVDALKSPDSLERALAATALARVRPDDPNLKPLLRPPKARGAGRAAHTITLVHGTWASDSEWYKPGGSFWNYVSTLRSDLYGEADFFFWSGGYSDGARDRGATKLKTWVNDHGAAGLDLMGHSHGASVMLLATQQGLNLAKLVLLSCPVHARYMPNVANVSPPIHSVRVKLDLVILADRGGQKFNHPGIQEHILPVWFDHSATHEQTVWEAHGVRGQVGM